MLVSKCIPLPGSIDMGILIVSTFLVCGHELLSWSMSPHHLGFFVRLHTESGLGNSYYHLRFAPRHQLASDRVCTIIF